MAILQNCLRWTNFDQPLQMNNPQEKDFGSDNNLYNPYSIASCAILQLYSMELGDPPVYNELNKAMRLRDNTHLHHLGPFAYALWIVTTYAE